MSEIGTTAAGDSELPGVPTAIVPQPLIGVDCLGCWFGPIGRGSVVAGTDMEQGAGPRYESDVLVGESEGLHEEVSLSSPAGWWDTATDGTFGWTCSCGGAGTGLGDSALAWQWAFVRHVPLDAGDPGTGTESSGPWPSQVEYDELMAAFGRVGSPEGRVSVSESAFERSAAEKVLRRRRVPRPPGLSENETNGTGSESDQDWAIGGRR